MEKGTPQRGSTVKEELDLKDKIKVKYRVRIYSGTVEDHEFEFGTDMTAMPQTIYWCKAPGFATIERVIE